jgi:glycosyltransferase involved in cell wall biosynthesis
VGNFKSIFSPQDPFKLRRKCASNRAWFVSPGYNGPISWSHKSIITVHDLMLIDFMPYRKLKTRIYFDYIVKRICQHSPLIYTVSEFTKQAICNWSNAKPENIVIVPNGVSDSFSTSATPRPSEMPYYLAFTNTKAHKNIPGIIKGFKNSSFSKAHKLLFVGEPDETLKAMVAGEKLSNNVEYAGVLTERELASAYKGAIATLFPSFYEGFGLPIIESMSVGTPVITSNLTSMPEIAGSAAILINPHESDHITDSINRVTDDSSLRDALRAQGLVRAGNYEWVKSRKVWRNALERVIG